MSDATGSAAVVWLLWTDTGEYEQHSTDLRGVFATEEAATTARLRLLTALTRGGHAGRSGDAIPSYTEDEVFVSEEPILASGEDLVVSFYVRGRLADRVPELVEAEFGRPLTGKWKTIVSDDDLWPYTWRDQDGVVSKDDYP